LGLSLEDVRTEFGAIVERSFIPHIIGPIMSVVKTLKQLFVRLWPDEADAARRALMYGPAINIGDERDYMTRADRTFTGKR
jgi:hypothetical protein